MIAINRAIEKSNGKFVFKAIEIADLKNEYSKSVMITCIAQNDFTGKSTLYLNKDLFYNRTITELNEIIEKRYQDSWWNSHNVEDITNHEIMHAMINYNNSYDKREQLDSYLREDKRVKGLNDFVDKYPDEFMSEMYVALRNGTKISDEHIEVYKEYYNNYLR